LEIIAGREIRKREGVVMINIIMVIVNAISIFLASWLTVRLALQRFYTQKWWERKAQAYSEIIGSLAKMRICFDKWEDEQLRYKEIRAEARKKVNEEYANAEKVIVIAEAEGSFIISEEAAEVLSLFLKELQKEDIQGNWLNDLDRHHGEVIKCIAGLREIAKRELSKR
jgi:hypothetical protein